MLSFTLHVNCLGHIPLYSVFLSLHETAIKHHQVTSSSYSCKFEFTESSAAHCWLILIQLFAIFLYLLICSAFSESFFYIRLREYFIFVQNYKSSTGNFKIMLLITLNKFQAMVWLTVSLMKVIDYCLLFLQNICVFRTQLNSYDDAFLRK